MPLDLIQGPPNSGRTGLVLTRFRRLLDAAPILVVPNLDDAFRLEAELARGGGAMGGTVTTFNGLFGIVAAAGGEPPRPTLTARPAPRLVGMAVEASRSKLGPLRRSARRAGFAASLDRLLAELQAAGLEPSAVEAGAGTLEGSAYLSDLATLFTAYEQAREGAGRLDSHGVARAALGLLDGPDAAELWGGRPVLVHGVDDFTVHQLGLVRLLAGIAEVTVSATQEEGREVLAARSQLVERLRVAATSGSARRSAPSPTPPTPMRPCSSSSSAPSACPAPRSRPARSRAPIPPLRRRARRGRVDRHGRRPAHRRRGRPGRDRDRRPRPGAAWPADRPRARVLRRRRRPRGGAAGRLQRRRRRPAGAARGRARDPPGRRRPALDAGPVQGSARAASTGSSGRIRRDRAQTAEEALALWTEADRDLPYDVRSLRDAGEAGLARAVGETAARMALRFLDGDEDGPPPGPGDGTELQAAAAISVALAEVCELEGPAPTPSELIALLRDLGFRAWIGPIEGRVRIADPQRLRAGRFDHVVIASLQDGEFPRRGGGDPFLSAPQRESLGLDPRRDDDAEERYLFYSSLSLARRSLTLSYRDSDDAGAALARSPLLDDVRRALAPPPGEGPDEVELGPDPGPRPGRHRPLALRGALGGRAGALARDPARRRGDRRSAGDGGARCRDRGAARRPARRPPARSRKPPGRRGRSSTQRSSMRLRAVPAYGGTTLEGFDLCSYRWFADHELDPKPLDPLPDAIAQGGLMHSVLERLYGEQPGGSPLPSPRRLEAWRERGLELVAEIAAERLGDTAGRAGDPPRRRTPALPLPRRRIGPRPRRLRAAAAGGGVRRGRGRRTAAAWRSTAGDCTGRSTASTSPPTAAPWSTTTRSPPRRRRRRSSRRTRNCSSSST